MKFINALSLCLPAVSAFPQALGKGIRIHDEDRLKQLEESHAQTIQLLNGGVVEARGDDLAKRALAATAVRGLAGIFQVPLSKMENKIISKIADRALNALGSGGDHLA